MPTTGSPVYRLLPGDSPQLFDALGEYQNRQDWRSNWRTTALLRCSDQALYFAGPAMQRLVAVAADSGKLMWSHPYGNYQLILQGDSLYGISGQIDKEVSRRFNPLTGEILGELKISRRACTRPTAACDAIFFRADEGSVRLDLQKDQSQLVSPMRPNCHDGVTVANGLLYWWPSVCDCDLTLYGITCLGPAGAFDFDQKATESARLEAAAGGKPEAGFVVDASDWPTFRANNQGTVTAAAPLRAKAQLLWDYVPKTAYTPSAPTAADALTFVSGSDGVIRALDVKSGKEAWTAFTGGEVRLPPTLAKGTRPCKLCGRLGVLAGCKDRKAGLAVSRGTHRAAHSHLRHPAIHLARRERGARGQRRGVCRRRPGQLRWHARLCAGRRERTNQVAE